MRGWNNVTESVEDRVGVQHVQETELTTRWIQKCGLRGDGGMSLLGPLEDAALQGLKLKEKRGKRGKLQLRPST